MNLIITMLVLDVVIFAHEIGHALAFQRHYVRIKRLTIGFGPKIRYQSPKLSFPLEFGLFPLYGFVEMEDGEDSWLRSRPYMDQAECYGGGIIMNFMLMYAFMSIYGICRLTDGASLPRVLVLTFVMAILGVVTWYGQRFISAYLLPILGVLMLGLLAWVLFQSLGAVSGPSGFVDETDAANSWYDLLLLPASFSFAIATFNMMPLSLLDGGRIAEAILRPMSKKVAKGFQMVTNIAFVGLIILVIGNEIAGQL